MFFRWIALPFVLLFFTVSSALAAYTLRPGDKIRLTYVGLPAATAEATVNNEGIVRFPLLGALEAAGKTIEIFQFDAQEASIGRRFSSRGDSGVSITIELDGFQMFAEILRYAPLFVIGDVMQPGEIEYLPGLTVRGAIAKAGGASAIPASSDPVRKLVTDEITNQRILSHELSQATAQLWRIDALLNLDPDWPKPDATRIGVEEISFNATLMSQRLQFFSELDAYNVKRASLIENIDGIGTMREMIARQIEQSEELVESDRLALKNIEELSNKGLADNSRVRNTQRSYALSTNQLLDLLRSQAETDFRESDLSVKLNEAERAFNDGLLVKKSKLEARLREMEILLQGSREALGGRDFSNYDFSAKAEAKLRVTLFRKANGVAQEDRVDLEADTIPGDVIEVSLSVE